MRLAREGKVRRREEAGCKASFRKRGEPQERPQKPPASKTAAVETMLAWEREMSTEAHRSGGAVFGNSETGTLLPGQFLRLDLGSPVRCNESQR
jgi:hypothetical protein